MSPEETELLQHLGYSLIDGLTWLVTLTILYGIFVLLFSISTVTLFRRGLRSRPQRSMLTVTVITFLVTTLHLAAQLAGPTILIRYGLINNPDMPLLIKPSIVNEKTFRPNLIILWTNKLLPIINDAVVIWRASILYPGQRRVMIPPAVFWVGTIACSLTYLAMLVSPAAISGLGTNTTVQNLLSASIALSLTTNASATLLIAYKLWTHRMVVVGNLGLSRQVSQAQNIMILLVESGLMYCGLQVVTLVLSFAPGSNVTPGSAQYEASLVFYAAYTEISAIYPTAIVVLVNLGRSYVDVYGFNDESDVGIPSSQSQPATLGRLSFATVRLDESEMTTGPSRALTTTFKASGETNEKEAMV